MISKNCRRYSIIFCVLVSYLFTTVSYANTNDEKHLVDTYNHLTTSFSMLREGIGTESIRRDILDNLEQSKLTPQTKAMYKSLLELCDEILINKETLQLTKTSAESSQKKEKQQKMMGAVMKVGVSAYLSGGVSLAPTMIGLLTSGSNTSSYNAFDKDKLNQDASIRKVLTDFEFKLSSLKSEIKNKYKINSNKFTRTTDLSEYIKIKSSNIAKQEKHSSLLKLHLNSPSAYMVTHDLALYEYQNKDYKKSRKYFLASIDNAPSIISRLPIRGKSNSMLGLIEIDKRKGKNKAEVYFKAALNDVPDDYMSLISLGVIATRNKQFDIAGEHFERLLILHPSDANINYVYTNYLIETSASDSKIVQYLKKTVKAGFDAELLRKDKNIKPYLAKLDLERVQKINISYDTKWNMLRSDVISITNVSSFNLTNVRISAIYREQKKGRVSSWYKYPKSNLHLREVLVGQRIKVKSFNSTKKRLYDVRIKVESKQGEYDLWLRNNRGQLVSM